MTSKQLHSPAVVPTTAAAAACAVWAVRVRWQQWLVPRATGCACSSSWLVASVLCVGLLWCVGCTLVATKRVALRSQVYGLTAV